VTLAHEVRECRILRRRRRLEARDDLDLAAAQAGRDLEVAERDAALGGEAQRLGDLRLGDPEQAQHPALVTRRAAHRGREGLGLGRRRPQRLQLARRSGQYHDRRPLPPVGGRHHQPGRRSHRVQDSRAARDHRLLAVRRADRLRVEVRPALHERCEDRRDALLQRLVQDHLASLERPDHLGGQVVGGRAEPAAGHDQVDALPGEEPQRALDVGRPVADDRDLGELHAELLQPVGEPRAVAVGNPAGEHLGARDDDAGAGAHVQEGRRSGGSTERPSRVIR
jgi:hypothetical protein